MGELMQNLGLNPKVVLSQIIAFVFLYVVLKRFLFGPIANMIETRNNEIRELADKARENAQRMEDARDEYERRLGDIEREARDRIQEATRQAHDAAAQIVTEARQARDDLLVRAREEIRREKERALVEIRDEVATLAVRGAEQVIRKELDESLHRDMVRRFIDEVEHLS